ncbi:MAG: prolyl oligopeptidase family serine peptidase [bacterium]
MYRSLPAVLLVLSSLAPALPAAGQGQPTLDDYLAPAFPYELRSARAADRIAWLAYERGVRSVYTAAAPDFRPVRLAGSTGDDGLDLTDLSISDDGRLVVYVRGHFPTRDGWVANPTSDPEGAARTVWAARTSGGEPWLLAEGGDPILSPDGEQVLFSRDGMWYAVPTARNLDEAREGAAQRPLFRVFGRTRSPVWAPDSRRIAFVSERGDHAFIGIFDPEAEAVTYLAPGVDRDTSPTWSPAGDRVAFIRRPGDSFGEQAGIDRERLERRIRAGEDTLAVRPPKGMLEGTFAGGHTLELWVADPLSGRAERFWHPAAEDTVFSEIRSITWAGEHVLFEAEEGEWRHIYSLPVSSRADEPEDLTPGEGFAEYTGISPDGEYLYYASNAGDIDRRHLWRTRVRGGGTRQLTEGEGIETYPAPLAPGDRVAVLTAGASLPLSVGTVRSRGGEVDVHFPTLPERFPADRHVQPVNVTLTAADTTEFHNQIFLPSDLRSGERRPALIFIHGGPRRQMLLGYHYMHFYHMAYGVDQYFADRGYVVLSVNYRSGIGYGRSFRDIEDYGRDGSSEYLDVKAAGEYLASRPDVDPERIGIWGLSYGGILTAQALARDSDLFAAGVDIAGVHMWGDPLEPESVEYRSSSAPLVEHWTSPVLLIHGDDDRNVDFRQTVGLVQLLRAHEVPHELIVFPDDVHDSLLYRRWITSFEAAAEFFRRHLGR